MQMSVTGENPFLLDENLCRIYLNNENDVLKYSTESGLFKNNVDKIESIRNEFSGLTENTLLNEKHPDNQTKDEFVSNMDAKLLSTAKANKQVQTYITEEEIIQKLNDKEKIDYLHEELIVLQRKLDETLCLLASLRKEKENYRKQSEDQSLKISILSATIANLSLENNRQKQKIDEYESKITFGRSCLRNL